MKREESVLKQKSYAFALRIIKSSQYLTDIFLSPNLLTFHS